MINANELRLGNWVYYVNVVNEPYLIDAPRKIELASVLNPIPLTEDILIKAGFEKDIWHMPALKHNGWKFYMTEQLFFTWLVWDNGHDDTSLCLIKTVHQLQNLYHILTGKELEINF